MGRTRIDTHYPVQVEAGNMTEKELLLLVLAGIATLMFLTGFVLVIN
jgi:hypothetical protein